jgi:hypothetical protein
VRPAVRKEIFIHFAFLTSFFIFISLLKGMVNLSNWPFWVGGIVGTLLPDIDHFIYILLLKPQELTSIRAEHMLEKRDVLGTLRFLAETRYERTKIIFHTATFQVIFIVLAFWVLTSSGSIFGRGVVLAFLLHMLVDQAVDLSVTGGLSTWFKNSPIPLEGREKQYFALGIVVFLVFALLL